MVFLLDPWHSNLLYFLLINLWCQYFHTYKKKLINIWRLKQGDSENIILMKENQDDLMNHPKPFVRRLQSIFEVTWWERFDHGFDFPEKSFPFQLCFLCRSFFFLKTEYALLSIKLGYSNFCAEEVIFNNQWIHEQIKYKGVTLPKKEVMKKR